MKIGIITHYYNSTNYGGNLQAFALCKFLRDLGMDAEQISYDKKFDLPELNQKRPWTTRLRKMGFKLKNFSFSISEQRIRRLLDARRKAILAFNQGEIPHSHICYNRKNISRANDTYDVFITGSDQVWHPKAVCGAYLLDFVEDGKVKLSYGASVATDTIAPHLQEKYREALCSFRAISVREEETVDLISSLTRKKVEWVLDPVFLLREGQWEELCSPIDYEGDYLFCYFLGNDESHRTLAWEYAKAMGLKIVTIPYLNGKYIPCDEGFGDLPLYEAAPMDFVSRIRNAKCVFTDSFHATAFSVLFQKEFFVFPRKGHVAMGSRIRSILGLLEREDRFCTDREQMKLDSILSREPIIYDNSCEKLEALRARSRDFLIRNIHKSI